MRLFIGIPLPRDVRLTQVTHELRQRVPGAKPVPAGSWHVTLRFLGDIKDPTPIEEALQQACSGHAAMPCDVTGVGAFQGPKRARVVWAKVQAGGLRELAHDVIEATKDFGEAPRGDFVAHATLARLPQATDLEGWIKEQEGRELASGTLDKVILYRSQLTKAGPVYQRRLEVPLQA